MNKVSESIWSKEGLIIPMASVCHLEGKNIGKSYEGLTIYMKHSKYNQET